MNRTPGKDSTITMLVPYSNGDAVKGFKYDGGVPCLQKATQGRRVRLSQMSRPKALPQS